MAQYHPSEDWLAAYASGAIDDQTEALIAAHLTFCPECRRAVAQHEEIAGALLEGAAVQTDPFDLDVRDALNDVESEPAPASDALLKGTISNIAPRPLAKYVFDKTGVNDLDGLNWTFYGSGISRAILVGDRQGALVRILKAQPGAVFPDHDHGSEELTLVLSGAYRDHTGRYATGDVQCAPAEVSHQPIVENEGVCYAFVVSEKPAIPKTLTAKIAQRIIGR